ncbi:hypothetical protein ONS95_005819 [Cadophora gregata]|uniref:uncharacterized protein n=1 Tax=Cadophora gregata TaxID=51156 RepID=UPI0026DB1555|nr:uncharacterized protein ONS95_005819 [Cadophora gregata]KAK0103820.1 hypothetical protein ONS95_005819 [Cadophora gregata]
MPSSSVFVVAALSFGSLVAALPTTSSSRYQEADIYKRQNATAPASGLTDVDILQFALTLENLEGAFYAQGFSKFPDSDFMALGLSAPDVTNLKSIATTEQTHVTTLTGAIAVAGFKPVQPCTYNFGFTTAAAMVATAGNLENIGVSAYLGAAPLVKMPAILTVAAEILTVESRHQTLIRTLAKTAAIPSAFDTPLGVRSVFSLAAPLISSCPDGSNLKIAPFPALALMPMPAMANSTSMPVGTRLTVMGTPAGATNCAFSNGGAPGGTIYVTFENSGCAVPQGVSGITYMHLTSSVPQGNILTDDVVVAGVQVLNVS